MKDSPQNAGPRGPLYENVTVNDVRLASAYYPMLIEVARNKHCITYSELVERAKTMYPDHEDVQNAIAVSTGRKLDVIRHFTSERGYPDLTSLVINKSSGECGSGFTRNFDPAATRAEVFEFDWDMATPDFDGFIKLQEKTVTPRKKRRPMEAKRLMAEYYRENRDSLPSGIEVARELIIEQLVEGLPVADAFSEAVRRLEYGEVE